MLHFCCQVRIRLDKMLWVLLFATVTAVMSNTFSCSLMDSSCQIYRIYSRNSYSSGRIPSDVSNIWDDRKNNKLKKIYQALPHALNSGRFATLFSYHSLSAHFVLGLLPLISFLYMLITAISLLYMCPHHLINYGSLSLTSLSSVICITYHLWFSQCYSSKTLLK